MLLQAIAALKTQYRMAGDIQLLSNTLVYGGKLSCGSDKVREAVLQTTIIPQMDGRQPFWLRQVIPPSEHRRYISLSRTENNDLK